MEYVQGGDESQWNCSTDASVVPNVRPVVEEGSRTEQIPVDYVVAADEMVATTLNVSTVCMVKNTIIYCCQSVC